MIRWIKEKTESAIDNLLAGALCILCIAILGAIIIAITWPFWVGLWAIVSIF